ncbi:MAG: Helix-turn-helix domain protein [Candidatus Udaeobacter sp.]|nr:MAG: Helix-turn-helix domain protein [Candidatus Udaeobacter sp.]
MTIEGLGKKFQEARLARNLTLDEAARMTKIRPARLAEIEADDFSQFPSLAYAKGFLLIYGKFLDVDVTPYLDAFEDSERVTVDGYSYLQENQPQKPVSAPVIRRRRPTTTSHERISPMPLVFGVLVLVVGFSVMKLILNVRRLAPGQAESTAQVSPSASPVPSPKAGQPGTTETSSRALLRPRPQSRRQRRPKLPPRLLRQPGHQKSGRLWPLPQYQVNQRCVRPSPCALRTWRKRRRRRIHPPRNRVSKIALPFDRLKGPM